ncbi:MAG: hydrogenase subunit MbhD domain-containing protein [Candidatus Marinimicrobia bacterium]|nr:hydrogenase subunit MbhD domain-containing protein [Candidatus Neomarinimicrobiota bacterium]
MISTIIIVGLGIIMIIAGLVAIHLKNLLAAIITTGVISLFASVIYLILGSPDVAMTEATIGSGLTTIIFLYALNRVRKENDND